MEQAGKKNTAAKVLKILALLLLIFMSLIVFLLLFTTVPMLLLDGSVQVDSGGVFDLLLRRTNHGSSAIETWRLFLGALPLLLDTLLLLADSIVLYSFLRQVVKRGEWFFSGGKRRWIASTVLGALCAIVPAVTNALIKAPVAASQTFAAKSWNPTSGILLFAVTLAITVFYIINTNRRQSAAQTNPQTTKEETP